MPAVSIILPSFDRLAYLRAAVASVFEQSCEDWELVIADDGSGRETREFLHELARRPRVRLLLLPHSGNPPAVRNRALALATGSYCAFLDSDDLWAPDKLARQLAALRTAPAALWSDTGFQFVDAQLQPLGAAPASARAASATAASALAQGSLAAALLDGRRIIVQSSVMVSRTLLEQLGGYDERLPVCGDYELWVRLALSCEIRHLPEALVRVRRHGQYYASDVAACRDFTRALAQLKALIEPPELKAILRRRAARARVVLVRARLRAAVRSLRRA